MMITFDELSKMSVEKLTKLAKYYDLSIPKNISKGQLLGIVKDHLEWLSSFPLYGGAVDNTHKYSVRVQRAIDSQKGQ
jgi:hypothetical protein